MLLRRLSVLVVAAVLPLLVLPGLARATSVPLPNSMAAVGDSITEAYDVTFSCVLKDCPEYSWSVGDNSVNSEWERILAANPALGNSVPWTFAVAGANMSALDGQVKMAASEGVQYLTVEMGANDLCVSSVSNMTPTSTFQSEFQKALTDFTAADPGAHIFVASIPNIYQLYQTENSNPLAQAEWNAFGICPDMLSASATQAQRLEIVAQEQADNQALGTVCASFSQCKFDNDAVYNTDFTSADVSDVDFFHPSVPGQNELAAVAWSAGYWPSTK